MSASAQNSAEKVKTELLRGHMGMELNASAQNSAENMRIELPRGHMGGKLNASAQKNNEIVDYEGIDYELRRGLGEQKEC